MKHRRTTHVVVATGLALAILTPTRGVAQRPNPEPRKEATIGLGNGVKIGEVTATSAVLWTRLTTTNDALDRLDDWDPERPHWRMPGGAGELRFVYWQATTPQQRFGTRWEAVDAETDSCLQRRIVNLQPATNYEFEAQARRGEATATFAGSFTTAPAPDSATDAALTFTISTCQDFPRRDDPANGHKIYRAMLALEPAFFVQTGDTLYYDKPKPFAKDMATARYKWNRLYALPYLRAFHARVPSYWMHDDHDLLKNDCWPGQKYGDLTFEQGKQIWREQVPQSDLPYRTFRWGPHVQIWLPEGREFRSPNRMPDGPDKSILGQEQWRWLEASLRQSDATFKFYVSATPVVGPDRKGKNDNHANAGFTHEGRRLRALLTAVPGVIVINGDRHWQYHSTDPETGLHEFGCGPASNKHAGGFKKSLQPEWQSFLRIRGGFLSARVAADAVEIRHHDVDGAIVHRVTIPATR
ncbi:MAG: alkaline phosphatase D family protein [bacterium]|nr:alkaline phosphatase D family protein [bacterium]